MRGPGGALFGGTNAFGNGSPSVVRSRDGGQTWTPLFGYSGVYPYGLAHAAAVPAPPAGGLPEGGAFAAADAFGLAWAHGAVQEDGEGGGRLPWQNVPGLPLRFRSVVAVETGPRDGGKAGRFLAAGYDGGANQSRVYASDDGGRTWAAVFEGPFDGGLFFVVAAPDGSSYAYYENNNDKRDLYGSSDGGQTWSDLGPVGPEPGVPSPTGSEWQFGIQQLAFGPDGHLYVGGGSGTFGPDQPAFGEVAGGVWRTAEPVVSVANEESPAEHADVRYGGGTYPNPTGGGELTVPLALPVAGRVALVVYDVLGREVARHAADYAAGRHEATLAVRRAGAGALRGRARARRAATLDVARFTVTR